MNQKIIICMICVLLLFSFLTGCYAEFEDNIYGSWISKKKVDIGELREPEYKYIIFSKSDNTYQTNILQHVYRTGDFVLFQEGDDYFFQLEYGSGNGTIFQYTFTDDSYSELKIKDNNDFVIIFNRESR